MHKLGCRQRSNPYAQCECAAMDMREHTEQLRRFNDAAPALELVNQLQAENDELNARLEKVSSTTTGWQPIETAPKDGRKLEVSLQSLIVHWEQTDEAGGRWVTPDGLTVNIPLTHWKPL